MCTAASTTSAAAAAAVVVGTTEPSKTVSSSSFSLSSNLMKFLIFVLLVGGVSWSLVLWYDEEKIDPLITIGGGSVSIISSSSHFVRSKVVVNVNHTSTNTTNVSSSLFSVGQQEKQMANERIEDDQETLVSSEHKESFDNITTTTTTTAQQQEEEPQQSQTVQPEPQQQQQSLQTSFLTLHEAIEKHPHCFTSDLLDEESGRHYIDLAQRGLFVLKKEEEEDVITSARYDHISCFLMKARYNCAVPTFDSMDDYFDTTATNDNDKERENTTTSTIAPPLLPAHAYKLVLTTNSTNGTTTTICDLHQLITDIGGPMGVARHLLHLEEEEEENAVPKTTAADTSLSVDTISPETTTTTTAADTDSFNTTRARPRKQQEMQQQQQNTKKPTKKKKKLLNYVLQGDSMLRSLFEAMACGWHSWITDIKYIVDGPPTSQAGVAQAYASMANQTDSFGRHYAFSADRMTTKIQHPASVEDIQRVGCHGNEQHTNETNSTFQKYYRQGVTVPPSLEKCSDDWGMVEFAHSIRFYYFFHLERFDNALQAYQLMGLHVDNGSLDDITAMIGQVGGNDEQGKKFLESLATLNRQQQQDQDQDDPQHDTLNNLLRRSIFMDGGLETLKTVQLQTIGRWYGADNPFIYTVPDEHSCMPGPIDDAANLILFCLLRGVGLRLHSGPPSGWLA